MHAIHTLDAPPIPMTNRGFPSIFGSLHDLVPKLLGMALALCLLVWTSLAFAFDPALSKEEIERLERGEVISHPDNFEHEGRRFIGGVSWALVDAPSSEVGDALDAPSSYWQILPKVRDCRWIALSREGDAIVQLEQGTSLAHGRYTIGVRRERESHGAEMIRFWVDGRYPRDLADARGWFRLEPIDESRTLVTYVIMIDLGPGLFKRLFEERIRASALRTPILVRRYFEGRNVSGG